MTEPFAYQLEDVRTLHKMDGRALVAWDMGLGKSFVTLFLAHRHPSWVPIVVVCPASAKHVWEQEASKHFGIRAEVLSTTRPPEVELIKKHHLLVVNYDILGQREGKHYGEGWLKYLKKLKPQMLVCDEASALGNPSSKQTRWVKELSLGIPHVLMLTGTPIESRVAQLWPMLNIIRPDLFPSRWQFLHRYCAPRRVPWGIGWDFSGASNLDELHSILTREVMIRRRKVDVLQDLPPKIRSVVPLELSAAGYREYRKAEQDFIKWLKTYSHQRATAAQRAERLMHGNYLKMLVGKLKIPAVVRWVKDFLGATDQKLILFGVHINPPWDVIPQLSKAFEHCSVAIHGSVPEAKRQQLTEQFLKKDKTPLLIGNIQAAGKAWSAPGVTNVALAEFPWKPGEVVQAEDRAWGIGRGSSTIPTNAYHLVAKGTIEERLVQMLEKKYKTASKIIDGDGEAGDFQIFDQLCQELLRKG